jgi:peroxiredoxin family protein
MAGRVLFFLQHGGYQPAYQAASMGITSAALGDTVLFVFAFDSLRQLVRGDFGRAHSDREAVESARAEGLGLPPPATMLAEARGLGARCIACDSMLRIVGVSADEAAQALDEVMGLPALWRLTEGARVLSF